MRRSEGKGGTHTKGRRREGHTRTTAGAPKEKHRECEEDERSTTKSGGGGRRGGGVVLVETKQGSGTCAGMEEARRCMAEGGRCTKGTTAEILGGREVGAGREDEEVGGVSKGREGFFLEK